jgi:hypothetical protein
MAHLEIVYQDLGCFHDAQVLLEQSLGLHKNIFLKTINIILGFMYLGKLYEDIGEYEKA